MLDTSLCYIRPCLRNKQTNKQKKTNPTKHKPANPPLPPATTNKKPIAKLLWRSQTNKNVWCLESETLELWGWGKKTVMSLGYLELHREFQEGQTVLQCDTVSSRKEGEGRSLKKPCNVHQRLQCVRIFSSWHTGHTISSRNEWSCLDHSCILQHGCIIRLVSKQPGS